MAKSHADILPDDCYSRILSSSRQEGKIICGIFGAIGHSWSIGTIRALALINRERGTDSLGFFDSSGKMIKCAEDPAKALRKANISKWLFSAAQGDTHDLNRSMPAWFIAGHTRAATRGKVNRQNSHPFRYGKIIGSHNGVVDAPKNYVVDSQYLFDTLNKADGDYQKAWSDIPGYWGVSWFDGESFYLQVHNGDLTVAKTSDNVYYYSSNWGHLEACIGSTENSTTLKEGQTFRFKLTENGIIMEELPKFTSEARVFMGRCCGGYMVYDDGEWSGYTPKKQYSNTFSTEATPAIEGVRDYDAEWRDAWEMYSNDTEHLKVN